jgi:hypothetical protein
MKKAQGDFLSQIQRVFATSGNAPNSKRELNSCSKRCEKHTTISAAPDPNPVEKISLCISHPLSLSLSLSLSRARALSLISVPAINYCYTTSDLRQNICAAKSEKKKKYSEF